MESASKNNRSGGGDDVEPSRNSQSDDNNDNDFDDMVDAVNKINEQNMGNLPSDGVPSSSEEGRMHAMNQESPRFINKNSNLGQQPIMHFQTQQKSPDEIGGGNEGLFDQIYPDQQQNPQTNQQKL